MVTVVTLGEGAMWPAAIPPKMMPDTELTMASSEETLSALATVSTKPASISYQQRSHQRWHYCHGRYVTATHSLRSGRTA
jgi:hypothetical protein